MLPRFDIGITTDQNPAMTGNVSQFRSRSVDDVLRHLRRRFRESGIETAALDARLLVGHALGLSAEELVLRGGDGVPAESETTLNDLAERRIEGEPVARLIGRREFWGRDFHLSAETLVPRPDTECVVEVAIQACRDNPPRAILDIGTGSGNLIVTLLRAFRESAGVATDISVGALSTARRNARTHSVENRLALVSTVWADAIGWEFDLIVSNPPYIASADIASLEIEVRDHDPPAALDGGVDGLGAYRRIAADLGRLLTCHGVAVFEVGAGSTGLVSNIFEQSGFTISQLRHDLAGHGRAIAVTHGSAELW